MSLTKSLAKKYIWLIYVDINQTESLTVDDLLTGTAALSLAIYLEFEHYRRFSDASLKARNVR